MFKECSGKSTGDQTTIEFAHWVEDARKKVDAISAADARGGGGGSGIKMAINLVNCTQYQTKKLNP